jgi:hypothetical protein
VDDSGNVYVTGESEGAGTGYECTTIKYNSIGDTVWVRRYNGPISGFDRGYALAVDDSGNVYVTGDSEGAGTWDDCITIKYNSIGDTLWVRWYNGPGSGSDQGNALAVDDSGNVYVTGYSEGAGTGIDYATIKYNSIGDTVWVRRYNGPGSGSDYGRALAVDGSGNVFVTGNSEGTGTGYDCTTIKYNSIGDTVWVRRYNGPLSGYDQGSALAVDGSGNVYVTGNSEGAGTGDDCTTIKYNSIGDTVWVRRYNGPISGSDEGDALAVDGSGNVYVTGVSEGAGTDFDYITLKYCRRDASISIAIAPPDTVFTDSTYNIEAWVHNFGFCLLDTVVAIATIDGYVDSVQATNLAPGDSVLAIFSPWTVVDLDSTLYTLTVCAEIPIEDEPTNDCSSISIFARRIVHDVGTTILLAPPDTVFTDSIYTPQAWIQNLGEYYENVIGIIATIDAYADTEVVFSLLPGDSALVTFQDWTVPSTDSTPYLYTVCTVITGDGFPTNDCAQKSIFAYNPVGVEESNDEYRTKNIEYRLLQNHPNPFSKLTAISYQLRDPGHTSLKIYDLTGSLVKILVDEPQKPGFYQLPFTSNQLPGNGVYFYRLQTREFTSTRKMILLQ